jgi:hypothetical protein
MRMPLDLLFPSSHHLPGVQMKPSGKEERRLHDAKSNEGAAACIHGALALPPGLRQMATTVMYSRNYDEEVRQRKPRRTR